MEIKTTAQTNITISSDEVKEIVIKHLEALGYNVEEYRPLVSTAYDDDQFGWEVFTGISVVANKNVDTFTL